MKEKFDYNDLRDMADVFCIDNESMELRIEVIKEICELPEVAIDWRKLDIRLLRYYAKCPKHIPADPRMFKRAIIMDTKAVGIYIL